MEIAKTYTPDSVESKWYQFWMENGYFKADATSPKPKYSIVIPPPNVTGVLHMGHMLNNTIQDVLIRHARMSGFETCWVPGTDHASIATEAKVVNQLREEGLTKADLGRAQFLEKAFEWKEKYGGIILDQLKKLGASCDWDRLRFTMEEDLSEAVTDTFIDLFKKGLIYRGERMINWDPVGKTALSDEEVITKDATLKLYHIQYAIEGEAGESLTIATSRPETIMADSAICVHPEDERYTHLHGKKALIPIINRAIPIIPDEYVSMEFGTGCLKVTPAHDKNDFELGQKHKLPIIDILDADGRLNEKAKIYIGEDRFKARKSVAADLEASGQLKEVEEYPSQVNTSERTGAVVEPRISLQWFVNMKGFIEKNPEVLEAVMKDEIGFVPSKFKNTYKYWLDNIKDWCISRQLWWGQQIPAWYDADGDFEVAKSVDEAIELFAAKGKNYSIADLKQDEDVVDTWFSSWLWPISVFDGFKNPGNPDIKAFYPTSVVVTGPDIIFFWIARMIMAGYEYQQERPFDHVYFTGIVRDKQGRKMSKQLGNSPDAIGLMDQYGTDGVRMGILLAAPAGNDLLFDETKVEQGRNFCNKIWNAYRLLQGWETADKPSSQDDEIANDWFDARMNQVLETLGEKYASYKLSEGLMEIYKLIWDDFCSWYLEMVKPPYGEPISSATKDAVAERMKKLMAILHPYMPFITEEIYQDLKTEDDASSICISTYPTAIASAVANDTFIQAISQIRNLRNSKGISPKEAFKVAVKASSESQRNHFEQFQGLIQKMANINELSYVKEEPEGTIQLLAHTESLYVFLKGKVDIEAELEKIDKEINYLNGFLKSVNAKLANEKFVANAKPELVERERQKKADAEQKIKSLESNREALS